MFYGRFINKCFRILHNPADDFYYYIVITTYDYDYGYVYHDSSNPQIKIKYVSYAARSSVIKNLPYFPCIFLCTTLYILHYLFTSNGKKWKWVVFYVLCCVYYSLHKILYHRSIVVSHRIIFTCFVFCHGLFLCINIYTVLYTEHTASATSYTNFYLYDILHTDVFDYTYPYMYPDPTSIHSD